MSTSGPSITTPVSQVNHCSPKRASDEWNTQNQHRKGPVETTFHLSSQKWRWVIKLNKHTPATVWPTAPSDYWRRRQDGEETVEPENDSFPFHFSSTRLWESRTLRHQESMVFDRVCDLVLSSMWLLRTRSDELRMLFPPRWIMFARVLFSAGVTDPKRSATMARP